MILIQEALQERFALDEILKIESLPCGPLSAAYKVSVRRGARQETWFVKKLRCCPEKLQVFAAQLHGKLCGASGNLVPPVIPTTDGASSFALGQDSYLALAWLDADPSPGFDADFSPAAEVCFQAGTALRTVHAACLAVEDELAFDWQKLAAPFLPSLPDCMNRSLSAAADQLAKLDPVRQIVASDLARLKDNLARVTTGCAQRAWRQQLIHGDFHPRNVLFQGAQVVGVVDFEFAHLDPAVYDVGYGAFMFAADGNLEQSARGFDEAKVEIFRRGYNEQAFKSQRRQAQAALEFEPLALEDVLLFVHLSAFVALFWLIDRYVEYEALRPLLLPRLKRTLACCAAAD